MDLESGAITSLLRTFDPAQGGVGGLSKNPVREEIYFYRAGVLTALDLTTLEQRPLYTRPAGYVGGSSMPPPTASTSARGTTRTSPTSS